MIKRKCSKAVSSKRGNNGCQIREGQKSEEVDIRVKANSVRLTRKGQFRKANTGNKVRPPRKEPLRKAISERPTQEPLTFDRITDF